MINAKRRRLTITNTVHAVRDEKQTGALISLVLRRLEMLNTPNRETERQRIPFVECMELIFNRITLPYPPWKCWTFLSVMAAVPRGLINWCFRIRFRNVWHSNLPFLISSRFSFFFFFFFFFYHRGTKVLSTLCNYDKNLAALLRATRNW